MTRLYGPHPCLHSRLECAKVNREQLTDHFGLVSDFLASCWNQLRSQSRVNKLQGRILFGGALSGRDTTATQKR